MGNNNAVRDEYRVKIEDIFNRPLKSGRYYRVTYLSEESTLSQRAKDFFTERFGAPAGAPQSIWFHERYMRMSIKKLFSLWEIQVSQSATDRAQEVPTLGRLIAVHPRQDFMDIAFEHGIEEIVKIHKKVNSETPQNVELTEGELNSYASVVVPRGRAAQQIAERIRARISYNWEAATPLDIDILLDRHILDKVKKFYIKRVNGLKKGDFIRLNQCLFKKIVEMIANNEMSLLMYRLDAYETMSRNKTITRLVTDMIRRDFETQGWEERARRPEVRGFYTYYIFLTYFGIEEDNVQLSENLLKDRNWRVARAVNLIGSNLRDPIRFLRDAEIAVRSNPRSKYNCWRIKSVDIVEPRRGAQVIRQPAKLVLEFVKPRHYGEPLLDEQIRVTIKNYFEKLILNLGIGDSKAIEWLGMDYGRGEGEGEGEGEDSTLVESEDPTLVESEDPTSESTQRRRNQDQQDPEPEPEPDQQDEQEYEVVLCTDRNIMGYNIYVNDGIFQSDRKTEHNRQVQIAKSNCPPDPDRNDNDSDNDRQFEGQRIDSDGTLKTFQGFLETYGDISDAADAWAEAGAGAGEEQQSDSLLTATGGQMQTAALRAAMAGAALVGSCSVQLFNAMRIQGGPGREPLDGEEVALRLKKI